jgi:hypothetical protein
VAGWFQFANKALLATPKGIDQATAILPAI